MRPLTDADDDANAEAEALRGKGLQFGTKSRLIFFFSNICLFYMPDQAMIIDAFNSQNTKTSKPKSLLCATIFGGLSKLLR